MEEEERPELVNSFPNNPVLLSLVMFGVAMVGSFIQITGGSWDVTSHLLLIPETFFTPSHILLYSGVGLLVTCSVFAIYLLQKHKELRRMTFAISLKMIIVGSVVSLLAGPADFLWHQAFGVDGLLSPTHIALVSGMLTNSIAVVLGLARLPSYLERRNHKRLAKAISVPAFAAMWLTMVWYVYSFALPFSNGQNFNFNLDPIAETIIAIIALPLVGSIVFITASKTVGRFGATFVTVVMIGINSGTNIVPASPLVPYLPWYLALISIAFVADLIISRSRDMVKTNATISGVPLTVVIAGSLIGSVFYLLGYPLLPMAFAGFLGYPDIDPINDVTHMFVNTLNTMMPFTIIVGAAMGIVGSLISEKKLLAYKPVEYGDPRKFV
ncbi:MAG: hypothetical protein M3162_08800 [Thermoproteota archaeon]|nr:hypothetical protein [Thermoproteota archaeon]